MPADQCKMTIRAPRALASELEAYALETGVSCNELVVFGLEEVILMARIDTKSLLQKVALRKAARRNKAAT